MRSNPLALASCGIEEADVRSLGSAHRAQHPHNNTAGWAGKEDAEPPGGAGEPGDAAVGEAADAVKAAAAGAAAPTAPRTVAGGEAAAAVAFRGAAGAEASVGSLYNRSPFQPHLSGCVNGGYR